LRRKREPRILRYWAKKPLRRVKVLIEDETGPKAFARMQRHKKSEIGGEFFRLSRRNPLKVSFAKEGTFPFTTEVYGYWLDRNKKRRQKFVFIAKEGEVLSFHRDQIPLLIEGLKKAEEWLK
jgi:hypothetical protein